MQTHIALFRGINVGGKNVLPMRELVLILEALGLVNIATYIQSGNVVFDSHQIEKVDLTRRIQSAINESHGFPPHVLLLELDDLENAVTSNPFPQAESEPKSLHLSFLASTPADPDMETLERLKSDTEQFELIGTAFYLHAPNGIGRSKLAARVERCLGVPATGRNWRSVCKILEMAKDRGSPTRDIP